MTRTVRDSRIGSQLGSRSGSNPDPSYPDSAAQVALTTGIMPVALYLFTEASGNLVDPVSARNLTLTGSPTFQAQAGDRRGVLYTQGASDRHTADVNDLAAASGVYVCAFLPDQPGNVFAGVVGRANAGGLDGVYCYMVNGQAYPQFVFNDVGANSLVITPAGIDIRTDRQPCLFVIQIDRAAAVARVRISKPGRLVLETSGSIAGFATFTGAAQGFGFGGYLSGSSIVGGSTVSYGMVAVGAQCEGADVPQAIASGLGWEG